MQIRLKKMIACKKVEGSATRSAVWAVQGMEGVLLGKIIDQPLGRSSTGWTWIYLDDQYKPLVRRLGGQVFPTRRAAIQALEIALVFF